MKLFRTEACLAAVEYEICGDTAIIGINRDSIENGYYQLFGRDDIDELIKFLEDLKEELIP